MSEITCPKCGKLNRAGAKFCGQCNQQLPKAQPLPAAATAPRPPQAMAVGAPVQAVRTKPLVEPPAPPPHPEPVPAGQQPDNLETRNLSLAADFAALPEGALVSNRRYAVASVRNEGHTVNVYLVYDRQGRLCPQCAAIDTRQGQAYCEACGHVFAQGKSPPPPLS